MTPEEIRARASERLELLRDARGALHNYQRYTGIAEKFRPDERSGAQHQARAARDDYNQRAREVGRALEEIGLSPNERMLDGPESREVNVIESACLTDRWGWLVLQHATVLIENAVGEWKRVEKDPSRYAALKQSEASKGGAQTVADSHDLVELKATVAKMRAELDSVVKPEPLLRSHKQWAFGLLIPAAGLLFVVWKAVLSSELESAKAKVTVELAPLAASVFSLTTRVSSLERGREVSVSSGAPSAQPRPRECPRLPKYSQLSCIETREGVKQPNTLLAKIPIDDDSAGVLEREQHRLTLLFKSHDRFEDWSGRFLILSNGKQRQLVLTQTEPGRAYELCQWLASCDDGNDRLDEQLRTCVSMDTIAGVKTCHRGVVTPPPPASSRP